MVDWIKLALLVLQLVDKIVDWQHDQGLISEGRRMELQAQLQRMSAKLAVKKQVDDEVDSMSEEQVDAELRDLGRVGGSGPSTSGKV